MKRLLCSVICSLILSGTAARAVEPSKTQDDPATEEYESQPQKKGSKSQENDSTSKEDNSDESDESISFIETEASLKDNSTSKKNNSENPVENDPLTEAEESQKDDSTSKEDNSENPVENDPLTEAKETASEDDHLLDLNLMEILDMKIEISSIKQDTIFTAPSTVSIIDRATIETYGFSSVSEALETLAGVSIARTFLSRSVPTVRGILQEHFTTKVLILIDGVPTWNAVTGDGLIQRISIDDVERIEVLKGPASVLYGTNAYTGAINFVLQKPENPNNKETRSGVKLRAGSLGFFNAHGNVLHNQNNFTFYITGSAATEDGLTYKFFDENAESQQVTDFQTFGDVTLSSEYRSLFGNHKILFNGYRLNDMFYGVTPIRLNGVGNSHIRTGYLGNYEYSIDLGDLVELKIGTSFDWNKIDYSIKYDDVLRSKAEGYRSHSRLTSFWTPLNWLSFELGVDFDYRKSNEFIIYDVFSGGTISDNEMGDRHVYEVSAFSQIKLEGPELPIRIPLTLLIGARYTKNELFNNNISARGTLVYNITESQSLKFVAGQAFRAPTLFELYYQSASATQSVFGNPELKPETSTSFELSYLVAFDKFFIQGLGYYAKYDNKIFRVRMRPDVEYDKSLSYTNGSPFSAWGAELEIRYQNPDIINGFATYTFIYGDDGDKQESIDHYNFKYIPSHAFSAGLSRGIGPFTISTVFNLFDKREGPLETIPVQYTWDANLAYHSPWGNHMISVKDILDSRSSTPEYVRRVINEIESGRGRFIFYTYSYEF